MSFTKGKWKVSGDYVIAMQNEEDYIDICRNLAFSDDAHLITAAPDLLEVCEAIKSRIHFIGLPSEPMNEDGPDWSKEIALLEAAITKAEEKK